MTNAARRKTDKPPQFQILLLDNDASQDVEVTEAEDVDFCQVKKHLRNGGSVFITSRASQKIRVPQATAQANYNRSRKTLGLLFHQHMRS
ncbi:MAG: hypothetical protein ACQCN6_11580 [Candidatus Bathyarchaeia archaeon]